MTAYFQHKYSLVQTLSAVTNFENSGSLRTKVKVSHNLQTLKKLSVFLTRFLGSTD